MATKLTVVGFRPSRSGWDNGGAMSEPASTIDRDATRIDQRPAAALWDFDGTLADTEPLWIEAEFELIGQLGGTWSYEHADQWSATRCSTRPPTSSTPSAGTTSARPGWSTS